MDLDRELAGHIAYVHKHGHRQQSTSSQTVPIDVVRAYIAKVGFMNVFISFLFIVFSLFLSIPILKCEWTKRWITTRDCLDIPILSFPLTSTTLPLSSHTLGPRISACHSRPSHSIHRGHLCKQSSDRPQGCQAKR